MDKGQENFVPLYESHLTRIAEKDFPSNATAIFKEVVNFRPKGLQDIPMIEQNLSPVVLKFAREKNIPIIFGDADVQDYWVNWARDFASLLTPILAKKIIDRISEKEIESGVTPTPSAMSRRQFIKTTTIAAGGWFLAPKVALVPGMITSTLTSEQNAVSKISGRLSGMISHFHPEDLNVFLRNVLMAHKLLMAKERLGKDGANNPVIPYNVGLGHAGMEDLLVLSKDKLREIVLMYPKPILRTVIDRAGLNALTEVDFIWLNKHDPQLLAVQDGQLFQELYKIKESK